MLVNVKKSRCIHAVAFIFYNTKLISFLYHTPLLKERNSIAKHLIIILLKLLCIHLTLYLL